MASINNPQEVEWQKRWYQAHLDRFRQDQEWVEDKAQYYRRFRASAEEALAIRDNLRRTGDAQGFTKQMQKWAVKSATAFNGTGGQMFINQLVLRAEEKGELSQLALLLNDALMPPSNNEEAASKIKALVDFVEEIKVGGNPAPRSASYMLSYFWKLANPDRWPVRWPSAIWFLEGAGVKFPDQLDRRYLTYLNWLRILDEDHERYESVAHWWDDTNCVLINRVLVERCAFGLVGNPPELLADNAFAMTEIAHRIGRNVRGDLAEVIPGFNYVRPRRRSRPETFRSNCIVDWRISRKGPGVRLWVNHLGAAVGIIPAPGQAAKTLDAINANPLSGFEFLTGQGTDFHRQPDLADAPSDFTYARWYQPEQMDDLDLRKELLQVAAEPILSALLPEQEAELEATGPLSEVEPGQTGPDLDEPDLDELAERVLIDVEFLEEIVSLLEDKGQVIFYGPPGTGKTFLANELSKTLTLDDPARRRLVQFHPSSSYEDFFQGYRPHTEMGRMLYQLTPGPLAQVAEQAAHAPDQLHIMVIDEINRANLPKVLGELLFLFEYRDQQISTLYQTDFRLPENLWFIGTMNTADRSIALVDAALRRRFHFIPFLPQDGPLDGLLDRWLEENGEPAWVGELVAMVNDELEEAIGSRHLQLGASHFMKSGLDEETLRRIWAYNIEPFVEDQFFGNRDQIDRFGFDRVYDRYRRRTADHPDQLQDQSNGAERQTGLGAQEKSELGVATQPDSQA